MLDAEKSEKAIDHRLRSEPSIVLTLAALEEGFGFDW